MEQVHAQEYHLTITDLQQIQQAQSEVIDRVCGVIENLIRLMQIRLERLRVAAGRTPDDHSMRLAHQPEQMEAIRIADSVLGAQILCYPTEWLAGAMMDADAGLLSTAEEQIGNSIHWAWRGNCFTDAPAKQAR